MDPASELERFGLPGQYTILRGVKADDSEPMMLQEDLGFNAARSPMVYLAGPYGGETQWDRARNVFLAKAAAASVLKAGGIPVFTHALYHDFHGAFPESLFVKAGLALVRTCDCLWAYSGELLSRKSIGTKGEIAEAKRLGRPWSYSLDEALAMFRS